MSTRSVGKGMGSDPGTMVSIHVLTADRVLEVHQALQQVQNPELNLGLRDEARLDLAIAHQFSCSLGGGALERAAALVQGILDERPFHDFNVETAFLAMLLHLDLNGFEPNRVSFDDHLRVFAGLASHSLDQVLTSPGQKGSRARKEQASAASELEWLVGWLEEHTRRMERQDYALAVDGLAAALEPRGFGLQPLEGDQIALVRLDAQVEKRLFGLASRTTTKATPLYTFTRPSDGWIPQGVMRDIRKACGAAKHEFYGFQQRLEHLLHTHLTLFARLAKISG